MECGQTKSGLVQVAEQKRNGEWSTRGQETENSTSSRPVAGRVCDARNQRDPQKNFRVRGHFQHARMGLSPRRHLEDFAD